MPRLTLVWSAAVVGVALAIAAIPLLMLDARANDGAASFTALFAFPMIVTGVLVELHRPKQDSEPFVARMAPWVGGLVVGILLLGIPATLLEPDYYEAHTLGGMLAVLGMFTFLMAFGVALGVVFWALVVLPAAALGRWAGRVWRGEPGGPIALPAGFLVVEAVVLVIVLAFQDDVAELVLVQTGALLLGLQDLIGWYEPVPHVGLWIVRAVVVLLLAGATAYTLLREYGRSGGAPCPN